jgi:hypothetical protein
MAPGLFVALPAIGIRAEPDPSAVGVVRHDNLSINNNKVRAHFSFRAATTGAYQVPHGVNFYNIKVCFPDVGASGNVHVMKFSLGTGFAEQRDIGDLTWRQDTKF